MEWKKALESRKINWPNKHTRRDEERDETIVEWHYLDCFGLFPTLDIVVR